METPDQIPFNELYRTGESRAAVDEIRNALVFAELDAEDALHDEAVFLAREGHLGKARDRLRMLLTLNPADGAGHLLLAKVFAAQRKWSEAIAELDTAAACGQKLPLGLRDALLESRDMESSPRTPRVVRTDGELKALRDEARRLRSAHSRMERETRELTHQAQVWRIATGVVTGVAALALLMIGFSWPGDDEYGTEQLAEVEDISEDEGPTLDELPSEDEELVEVIAPSNRDRTVSSKPAPVEKEPTQARIDTPSEPVDAYTVRSGDTLWKIAGRVYSDKTRWKEIRDANQHLLKGDTGLRVGMVLEIPQKRS